VKPERHYGYYALYVLFFPQLVAGPIERAGHLMPQLRKANRFEYDRVVSGLRLMLWGFFKKVVIADNLSLVVNQVYNNPGQQNALTYVIATIFFAFQIYCDFSGYSDIARGSARVMGYDLVLNFNIPYIARSIREFWTRWHISLSTWFRDYVYIPLGGNRGVKWRTYYNLMITFMVSGLWHGANWTFVIWGGLHGLYMIVERMLNIQPKENSPAWKVVLQTAGVFLLVYISWIFFRADNVQQAFLILKQIAVHTVPDINRYLHGENMFTGLGPYSISFVALLLMAIGGLYIADILKEKERWIGLFRRSSLLRMGVYFFLLYAILFLGYFGEVEFIYFQF
jgi:D-alanyl-lipoteichoic acid acyltransferase DltB (MBOAT superfamily)